MSAEACASSPALTLVPEDPAHGSAIEALYDRAFGPGRFVKVSERVREIADFAPELSFCAVEDGRLSGVVRMWRIAVGGQPLTFLGPLAVLLLAPTGKCDQDHIFTPRLLPDLACNFVAVELRHSDIEDDDIGTKFLREDESAPAHSDG